MSERIVYVCGCIGAFLEATNCRIWHHPHKGKCPNCHQTVRAYNLDRLLRIEEKAQKHKSEFEEGGSLRGALAALNELWDALAEPGERTSR